MLFSIKQSILTEETLANYGHSPIPPMFPPTKFPSIRHRKAAIIIVSTMFYWNTFNNFTT